MLTAGVVGGCVQVLHPLPCLLCRHHDRVIRGPAKPIATLTQPAEVAQVPGYLLAALVRLGGGKIVAGHVGIVAGAARDGNG
jgi:hypothetical protein